MAEVSTAMQGPPSGALEGLTPVDPPSSAAPDGQMEITAPPADTVSDHLDKTQERLRSKQLSVLVLRALKLTWSANRTAFLMSALGQLFRAVMASAIVVVGSRAVGDLLAVSQGGISLGALIPSVALLAVVSAATAASMTFQQQQQRLLNEDVTDASWNRILDVTARLRLEFYESPTFYDRLQRIKGNAITQPVVATSALFGLLGGVLGAVGLLVVVLTIQPLLVPMLLLAGIPTLILGRRASRLEFGFVERVVPTARAREYLRLLLSGREEAKEIRVFGSERALRSRCAATSSEMRSQLAGHVRQRQLYAVAGVLTSAVGLGASFALLGWFLSTGRIGLGGAAGAVIGLRMLSARVAMIVGSATGLYQSGIFLADLEAFLALAEVADGPGTGRPPPFERRIAVEGVGYTYPGNDEPALRGIDLHIEPGEVVALVGDNGSGKTTLAKLLAGLYLPSEGAISWDGVAVSDLEPADVRRGVAVIFQDFIRYQLSALDNIGLGDPDTLEDEQAARAAASLAGADEFLTPLPGGYQTILSKQFTGGRDLSVGQWQRVALARAVRCDAPLVILDEPSSALDPRAEHRLFSDMRRTLAGRAALVISHRYSTVRSADRIYVMQAGRIVECGTHEDLLRRGGLYSELFALQAEAYR